MSHSLRTPIYTTALLISACGILQGAGNGLKGEYFNNTELLGSPVLVRTDATVGFDWNSSSPGPGIATNRFSVRWTGQVETSVAGAYRFSTISDAGARLWVNNVLVLNHWTSHTATKHTSAAITLAAGQKYELKMEFYENSGNAVAKLLWTQPGQAEAVIPQANLYSPVATPVPVSIYLSDLSPTLSQNGLGPYERDRSNGDSGARDGNALSIGAVKFARGLGVYPRGELRYALAGRYKTFVAFAGVDDEVGQRGSVVFQVWVDNAKLFETPVLKGIHGPAPVEVNVEGKNELKLIILEADDFRDDHADWADARLLNGAGGGPTPGGSVPSAPTVLTAVPGDKQVLLSWAASAGATSYSVYRGTAANGQAATPIMTGITGTSAMNGGLTNGTRYYYRVAAANVIGTGEKSNEANAMPAAPVTPPPTLQPPPAPTGLTAAPGDTQVILAWTASAGATSYNLYRGTATGAEASTPVMTGIAGTTVTNTGLTNGTKYFYKVAGANGTGIGEGSNEANATPSPATGGTSCSSANVQSAINSASSGATVVIAAGDCTWTSRVTINKAITLKGAGTGKTIVRNGISGPALVITLPKTGTLLVSDITFDAMSRDTGSDAMIQMEATGNNLTAFRLHHFEILNQFERGLYVFMEGFEVGGLIDHGHVTTKGSKWLSIEGTGPEEHQPFTRPLELGSSKFIFIEDNWIENVLTNGQIDGFIDAYTGARYVYRHNTMTGCAAETAHHGADSGNARGTHSFEIYDNTFTVTLSCKDTTRALNFRSGTGVVFNNIWTGSQYNYGMELTNYRSDGSYAPWGKCDGTSPWDQNVPGQNGWACLDQIGHVFGPTKGGANTLEPLYEWSNLLNGKDVDFHVGDNHGASIHIKENRDYYNDTRRPGYTPYTYPHPLQGTSASAPISNPTPLPTPGPAPAPVSTKFSTGARIQINTGDGSSLSVRNAANGTLLGQQQNGALGTIVSGGTQTNSLFWWQVNFDSGADGWAAEVYITAYTAPAPTPVPIPTPAPAPPPPPTIGAYYVSNSAACSNTASAGTLTTPWCTITFALPRIAGGNTLYVRGGTYSEQLNITGPSGTAAAPTKIMAYPGETVILKGAGGNNGGRQKIVNASYIIFDGFKITEWNQGLFVENANNIVLQNLDVYSVGQEAVHIKTNSHHVTLQNSSIHDTRTWQYNGEGVYVGTSGSDQVANGVHDNTNNILVRNNTIYNTNDECIEVKEGAYAVTLEGNTLSNCLKDSSITSTGWGSIELMEREGHYGGNPGHIVRNNVINTLKTGIGVHTGASVYNNIIYGQTGSYRGISIDNPDGDAFARNIYHNTIDLPSARAVAGTGDVRNNIGPSSSGNLPFNLAYFVNATNRDYHLVSTALGINTGTPVGIATDKDGRPRDASPDIGAYEFVGAASTSTPVFTAAATQRPVSAQEPTATPSFTPTSGPVTSSPGARFQTSGFRDWIRRPLGSAARYRSIPSGPLHEFTGSAPRAWVEVPEIVI